MNDESLNCGMPGGCPTHGDDYMMECSVCGAEFCSACFKSDGLCKDCAAQAEEEATGKDSDFDDVENVDAILGKDETPPVVTPRKRKR
ncbi:MAG: hypothetical protein AB7T27_05315 [Kiritimatiellia bacterium]